METQHQEMNTKKGNRILGFLDIEPDKVSQESNILDELGLTDARVKMDEAHNKIIEKKHKLRQKKEKVEGLSRIPYPTRMSVESPFEDNDMVVKDERQINAEIRYLEAAVKKASFNDEEYRKISKDFLQEIRPIIESEDLKLQNAIDEAREEYERTVEQAKQKLKECISERKRFIVQVNAAVLKKFKLANSGSLLYPVQGVEELICYSFNSNATTNINLLLESIARKENEVEYLKSDEPGRRKVFEDYTSQIKIPVLDVLKQTISDSQSKTKVTGMVKSPRRK